jgi:hypothetical protein
MGAVKAVPGDFLKLASSCSAVFALAATDPEFFRSNGDLRGYKADLYEGGIRTPFLASWPGKIQAGITSVASCRTMSLIRDPPARRSGSEEDR